MMKSQLCQCLGPTPSRPLHASCLGPTPSRPLQRPGAFTLNEGRPLWETRLDHDVITAPVVAEGKVYLSTFDGTVWCIEPDTGRVNWCQQMQATSAPWVYQGDVYVSHRENAPRGTRQPGDPSRTRQADATAANTAVPRERTSRVDA